LCGNLTVQRPLSRTRWLEAFVPWTSLLGPWCPQRKCVVRKNQGQCTRACSRARARDDNDNDYNDDHHDDDDDDHDNHDDHYHHHNLNAMEH